MKMRIPLPRWRPSATRRGALGAVAAAAVVGAGALLLLAGGDEPAAAQAATAARPSSAATGTRAVTAAPTAAAGLPAATAPADLAATASTLAAAVVPGTDAAGAAARAPTGNHAAAVTGGTVGAGTAATGTATGIPSGIATATPTGTTAATATGTTAATATDAAAAPSAMTAPARSGAGIGAGVPLAVTALGCLIEASAVAEVGTAVVGVIDSVAVERGDAVRRGQVLAQHEHRVERAAVLLAEQKVGQTAELRAAKSQIGYARKKVERTETLTELNFVSGQALDQAQTESTLARMRLAQAIEQQELAHKELDLARAQLQQRTIVSPLDGVVVERLVSPGERVENRPVFRIAQIDPLRVEVVLPASAFGAVQVGADASVTPELPGAATRSARVAIVDRVVDAGSNTFRARLTLPNPGSQLPAGLRCRVEFR